MDKQKKDRVIKKSISMSKMRLPGILSAYVMQNAPRQVEWLLQA